MTQEAGVIRDVRVASELLTLEEGKAGKASRRRCHVSLNVERPPGKSFSARRPWEVMP